VNMYSRIFINVTSRHYLSNNMDFIHPDFLLQNETAKVLYHNYAKDLPIIDYHCHLPAEDIAVDKNFDNITQIWLYGDHYKWRAMRTFGIEEKYITGNATDKEKFLKWAETVPATLRNPLYHWTHLELKRYFGINTLLNPDTAETIYEQTREMLRSGEFSTQKMISSHKVEVVCTTDDPIHDLRYHQKLRLLDTEFKMLPAFRPDKAMDLSDPVSFNEYVRKLEKVSEVEIISISTFLKALRERHDYFHALGCRLSDHGLNYMDAVPFKKSQTKYLFSKILEGKELKETEQAKVRSHILYELALMDPEKGWTQQFHLGALRNNNQRLARKLGADAGFDSIGDFSQAERMSGFLNKLDSTDQLAKTILYNLNPADNAVFATMAGNFNDGTVPGKIQWGAAWWFLDQLDGMTKQINTLSNLGLLSVFVGMLTDSRSFMSYPRHEYFRRLLCNIIGNDVKLGHLPDDEALLGKLVQDVCYYNAKNYFNF